MRFVSIQYSRMRLHATGVRGRTPLGSLERSPEPLASLNKEAASRREGEGGKPKGGQGKGKGEEGQEGERGREEVGTGPPIGPACLSCDKNVSLSLRFKQILQRIKVL